MNKDEVFNITSMNDRVHEAVEDSHVWFPDIGHEPYDLPFWLLCLGGEVGELQNKAKKWVRGSLSYDEVRPLLADELVDALVYAFNVAATLGIDLEAEYDRKRQFNSERFGPDGHELGAYLLTSANGSSGAGSDSGAEGADSSSGTAVRTDVSGSTQGG
jgi:NTP pyrophosphatase (non-canonical NTP hydrolase)